MTHSGSRDELTDTDGPVTLATVPANATPDEPELLEWVYDETTLSETNFLAVVYDGPPDEWMHAIAGHEDHPVNLGLISVTDGDQAVATHTGPTEQSPSRKTGPRVEYDPVTSVPDPGDLQALGTTITAYLEDWDETAARTVVVIDSLTAMLDHVERSAGVQFLQILRHRLTRANASAYCLITPTRHDSTTILLLQSLVDRCREVEVVPRALGADQLEDPLVTVLEGPRRVVVDQLMSSGSLSIETVVDRIADATGARDRDRIREPLTDTHLPLLEACDLVEYDPDSDTIELAIPRERVEPYLQLARDRASR